MALSKTTAIGTGSTNEFAVNFALGYIDQNEVSCRVGIEADGSGTPIYRAITFVSANLLRIAGTAPGLNVPVVFSRTVPKDYLIINFDDGDTLTEANLDTAQKQSIMIAHEAVDQSATAVLLAADSLVQGKAYTDIKVANIIGPVGPPGPQGGIGPIGPIGPQGEFDFAFIYDTTSADRSKKWFNVIDYGADPTGAAGSSAAFQAALNAIAALPSGGVLYIPPGTFKIGTGLTFSATNIPLFIQGAGRGQSVIIQSCPTVFAVSGNGRFQMEGLFVLQSYAGGSFLALNSAAEYVIRNIRAYTTSTAYWWDSFFSVSNPLLGSIQDLYIRNTPEGYNTEMDLSKLRGTGFLGVANAISVLNSFHNCYFAGFYTGWWFITSTVPGNEGNYFSNCTVEASRIGIWYQNTAYSAPQPVSWFGGHMNCYERCFLLEGCSDPHIIGGLFYRNVVYNIAGQHIFTTTKNGNPATGAMITGNTFRVVNNASGKDAGSVAAIHLDGGDWHTVSLNKFDLSPGFTYAVFSSGTNVDVQNNKSRGSGLSSIGVTLTGSGGYTFGNRANGGTPG